jgi:hypothetical protein
MGTVLICVVRDCVNANSSSVVGNSPNFVLCAYVVGGVGGSLPLAAFLVLAI